MATKSYLAVDLGASSGRLVAGLFDGRRVVLEPVHRFANGPVVVAGSMYWDLLGQWTEVLRGLSMAASSGFGRGVVSVGVDTWGVDFGLLGPGDELLGNPYHYRDGRTEGMLDEALAIVGRDEVFAETGLQFMQLNTLYQLLAIRRAGSPLLDIATRLLMIPDLFHWMLTGNKSNERTNASTTQLYNPVRKDWSSDLLEKFDLPRQIFGPLDDPGTRLGPLLPQVASATGLSGVEVVLPGSHDTASAVVAVPAAASVAADPDWCYISSGTWSLMGVEVASPVISDTCARLNFTNEAGVGGTTRLLKNICGLWLLQECRRVWQLDGHDYSWEELNAMAADAPPLGALIDPDDPRLLAPERMPDAIREASRAFGMADVESHAAVIRCALESLALKCRQVLGWLEELTAHRIGTIHIVGGGAQNRLLCQMTADACHRSVVAGPVEATAIGNLMIQAIAAGDVGSMDEARALVRDSFPLDRYEPGPREPWDEAFERWRQ